MHIADGGQFMGRVNQLIIWKVFCISRCIFQQSFQNPGSSSPSLVENVATKKVF